MLTRCLVLAPSSVVLMLFSVSASVLRGMSWLSAVMVALDAESFWTRSSVP
jgi:hypothetical protein